MNERSPPPQESMGRHVRNGGRESKRERKDSVTERKGEHLYAWSLSKCQSEREQETRQMNGESEDRTVVWTNNKGFNKNVFRLS